MTTRTGAAVAAGFIAIGILVGAAGTIVVRDVTATDLAGHTHHMTASTGSMGGMAGMMSMMGTGQMPGMVGGAPMGPNASMTPGDHESHHATPGPETTP